MIRNSLGKMLLLHKWQDGIVVINLIIQKLQNWEFNYKDSGKDLVKIIVKKKDINIFKKMMKLMNKVNH